MKSVLSKDFGFLALKSLMFFSVKKLSTEKADLTIFATNL